MNSFRVVLDTNCLISGLLWPEGAPARVLDMVESKSIAMYSSHALLQELVRVIHRPKFQNYLIRNALNPEDLLSWCIANSVIVITRPHPEIIITEDPADDSVVLCAVEAGVDYIVSGDHHLRKRKMIKGVEVVSPTELLAAYNGQTEKGNR